MTDNDKQLAESRAAMEFQSPDSARLMELAIQQGDAGVAALERLVAMRERAEDRAAERAYAEAFTRVQAEMQPIATNRRNEQTRSNYANLEALYNELVPVYTRHGFALSFDEDESPREGWIRVVCEVMHSAGHMRRKHIDLPLDDRGMAGKTNKTQLHATGSTLSYGRRYLALLAFNVATFDDDDGNDGAGAGRPDEPCITDQQAADLEAMANEVGADLPKFCKWMGVESLTEIKASRYEKAVRGLEARRRKA